MSNPYTTPNSKLSEDISQSSITTEIVTYWEKKRIIYNLTLLIIGVTIIVLGDLYEMMPPLILIAGIIVYGFFANIFYTLGPYANIVGVNIFNMRAVVWRPLFIFGLAASVLLTSILGVILMYLQVGFE